MCSSKMLRITCCLLIAIFCGIGTTVEAVEPVEFATKWWKGHAHAGMWGEVITILGPRPYRYCFCFGTFRLRSVYAAWA